MTNRNNLLPLFDDWSEQVNRFRTALEEADAEQIRQLFASARQYRNQLPENTKGVLPQVFECYVDVPDHPGSIGQVTTALGEHQINVTNIAIMENREESLGVLRLTFAKEAEMEEAVTLLKEMGFPTYIRD
jgi:prephenate dehydrogenase